MSSDEGKKKEEEVLAEAKAVRERNPLCEIFLLSACPPPPRPAEIPFRGEIVVSRAARKSSYFNSRRIISTLVRRRSRYRAAVLEIIELDGGGGS